MPRVLLGAAIATELAGTLALPGSDAFPRVGPSIVVVATPCLHSASSAWC
ncbi:MAG TPA: hypothetical protein VJP81_09745 [Candidatus Dormibacteraeota bacterium]|nr:hypothetical protein [Candidatus Dormibacteraeota bacterium]